MKKLMFLLLVGCADDGALGQTTISTECDPTDFACVTAGLDGPIAVGGVVPLAIDFTTTGSSSTEVTLLSGNPGVLKAADTEVMGVAPGVAALVMLNDTTAIDFLHLSVVAPNRIGIHRHDGGLARGELIEELDLLVGDEISLEVEPYLDSQHLLGNTTSTWSTTTNVALLHDGLPGRRRLVARTPGEADVHVEAFGFEKTIRITVQP